MAARHRKGKASGGKIMVASGNPNVIEEARERKRGGRANAVAAMEGAPSRHRPDRKVPGRKSGGRVGANMAPLSTAHSDSKANAAPHENSSD